MDERWPRGSPPSVGLVDAEALTELGLLVAIVVKLCLEDDSDPTADFRQISGRHQL